MPSNEYLQAVFEKVKQVLPDWLWQRVHRTALASSGGRAKANRKREEKVAQSPTSTDVHVPTALKPEVESQGPQRAKIAFVGASLSPIDAIRKGLITGPAGATFRDMYLKPLGLKKDDVFITNAVPLLLKDDSDKPREPTGKELALWKGWLEAELERAEPEIVVALGKTAKRALGDLADFVLPHPHAIVKFGDRGEVARKLRRIEKVLTKLPPTQERTQRESPSNPPKWTALAKAQGRFAYQNGELIFDTGWSVQTNGAQMPASGEYETGVWTEGFREVFLKGEHPFAGRYLVEKQGDKWHLSRPENQEPLAKSFDLAAFIRLMKQAGERWVLWPDQSEVAQVLQRMGGGGIDEPG